jgi:2-amino-4-hydroxy-6-hydroxymethyldihydropteridine diphosphokinase
MILIGLGANLLSAEFGAPPASLEAALGMLQQSGVAVTRRSRWYRTAPVPASDQPWFVNGVAAVETALDPAALLALLQAIETRFGRVRRERNAARVLDLDLLDYEGRVSKPGAPPPTLPHPRLAERAFVLRPLAEVAPGWRHPATGAAIDELLLRLPPGQAAEPII